LRRSRRRVEVVFTAIIKCAGDTDMEIFDVTIFHVPRERGRIGDPGRRRSFSPGRSVCCEVAVLLVEGRLTLGLPGSSFSADILCEAVARFAKALGAKRDQYSVLLQL